MSAINQIFLYLSSVLFIFGCTEKKNTVSRELSPVTNSQFSYMGPVERTIDLKLELNKAKFNHSATLRAVVSLPYDYNHPLQYQWKLGPHVQLQKSSQLSGTISSIKKDTPVEIMISVDQFQSDETRYVRFEIFGTAPNKRIFSDGIISSHQENSFESIVQEVEKINAKK